MRELQQYLFEILRKGNESFIVSLYKGENMGIGYLKVELRTGDEAFPVGNARVLVKNESNDILFDLMTDENGNTVKVKLEAPDKTHTLNPNDQGPYYSTYEVEVKPGNGYMGEIIHGVQIFDTETSILPVQLTPVLEDGSGGDYMEDIYIPPIHGIQIPKNSASYDYQSFTRAVREVFIPEYMTVHLGKPNSEATNVRVKFIDYIKNVASSEIFPSWPQAALEANIYAQISFALNRVFTVWYRSRGFNFDITNSTTVDQYFVYGRNIFENISNIVDRIFNVFIRRRGRLEPFFAQYCNGTTSTCEGLSQWGTVPLAERGYSPIEILKYYYPSDIELVESTNFSNRMETYPGTPLREGSSGKDVLTMQTYLNRIRANYPLIPQITNPNGVFGSTTVEAVREFQRTFDLPADGIIGKNTWYRITSLFVGVKRLAELTSEGIRIGIGLTPPTVVIQEGSKGEYVVELQFILNFISQFYPAIPLVIEDGTFGASTKRSVVEFQKIFGLTPDGIVGPATWSKLYTVFRSIEDTVPTEPEGANPVFPGTALRVGSRGSDVMLMQQYLNKIATVYTSIPKLVVDGIFGSNMQVAVMAFQRQFGLTPDGVIGLITWNKIIEVYNNLGAAPPTVPPINPPFPGTELRVGSTGPNVSLMQQYLNKIATVYTSIPTLAVDGIFGPRMEDAVKAFQRQFGLTPDGVIGQITWYKIVEIYNNLGAAPSAPPFPGTLLRVGSTGSNVLLMQQYLNSIARVYTSIPVLAADGVFGPKMEEAVKAFQRQFGLSADGVIGKLTWDKIVEVYVNINRSQVNPPFPGTLRPGSTGSDVLLMQRYLNSIGAVYTSIPQLVADGIFGSKMQASVTAFQKIFGLTADGIIGNTTWNRIVTEYDRINKNQLMAQMLMMRLMVMGF